MFRELVNQIRDRIRQYLEVRLSLLRITLIEQAAALMSNLIFLFVCLFIFFCILLFLGLGMAEVFSDMGLGRAAAFFATIGIYVFVLLLAMVFRKGITGYFSGIFIRTMTEQKEADNNGEPGKS